MENAVTIPDAGSLVNTAGTVADGFLSIGTKIVNWALTNPLFLLVIIIAIIFMGVGLVKKFTH